MTPTTVGGLSPADHMLVLESVNGSVSQSVRIAANQTAQVSESIYDEIRDVTVLPGADTRVSIADVDASKLPGR